MSYSNTHTYQNKPIESEFDVRLDYYREPIQSSDELDKPHGLDFFARSRDAIADPINELIDRLPLSGGVDADGHVYLHNGLRVPLVGAGAYYGEFSHLLVVNKGVHEPLEEFIFQEVVNSLIGAPTMLELGAYWSHYSMWLTSKLPMSRAIMVEPEPENLKAGEANFSLNELSGHFLEGFVGRGQFEVDKFMADSGTSHLDILHSDIQGFEIEMLEGADTAFREDRIDRIFISTHSDELHSACIEKLESFGFQIIAESDFQDTTSWDGLIFAVRSPEFSPLKPFRPCTRSEANRMNFDDRRSYVDCVRMARG